MIRYSIVATTSAAIRYFDSEQIQAAKGAWGRGYGLSNQVASLHGAVNLNARDRGNLSDCQTHLLDLLFLGEDLRVWEHRSGRYGCFTVPRED